MDASWCHGDRSVHTRANGASQPGRHVRMESKFFFIILLYRTVPLPDQKCLDREHSLFKWCAKGYINLDERSSRKKNGDNP